MSEEEIIDIFETVIRANRFDGLYTSVDIIVEAMQGLLDLYNQTKKDLKNDIEARDILVQYFYNTKEDIKNIINNHYPDVAVQKILELLERKTDK
jgi:antitoxin component HigA of HigAB toxin-antitoxin module